MSKRRTEKSKPQPIRVFVQLIWISWNKKSRGDEGARKRNQIPDAFLLPEPASEFQFTQQIFSGGQPDFSLTERRNESAELPANWLSLENNQLEINWSGNGYWAGMPNRKEMQKPFSLPLEEYLQVKVNGRKLSWDDPWYEAHLEHPGNSKETACESVSAKA